MITVPHNSLFKPPLGAQLNSGHPINRGLVGYWGLLEGGGSRVHDLSGNRNTGTFVGDTKWVPGKYGSCLSFDGAGDYVNGNSRISAIGVSNNFSISAWIKGNNVGATYDPIVTQVGGSSDRFFFGIYSSATPRFIVAYYNGASYATVLTSIRLVSNVWYHVVVTHIGSTCTFALYVNGVNDTAAGYNYSAGTTPTNLQIGGATSASNYMDGSIDNVMIYDRALSASEIAQLYRDPFAGLRQERIELLTGAMGGGTPSEEYAGSGSGTVNRVTASAGGTYTVPVYTATGAPSASKATANAAGTFVAPVYTGTGGSSVEEATGSASGTYTAPAYSGIGSAVVVQPTASAAGTFTVPAYVGSGTPETRKFIASGSGLYSFALYSGSGNPSVGKTTGAATGTFVMPVYAGTGASVVSQPRVDASGTFVAPVYAGAGTATVRTPMALAVGTYGLMYTGSGNGIATRATGSADGLYAAPTVNIATVAFLLLKRSK